MSGNQASGYDLTPGIHGRIEATIRTVADALDTGNVHVNRNMIGAPAYLQRFALEQVISVNTAAAGGNAGLIAMGE